jgi:hypothetical protein
VFVVLEAHSLQSLLQIVALKRVTNQFRGNVIKLLLKTYNSIHLITHKSDQSDLQNDISAISNAGTITASRITTIIVFCNVQTVLLVVY